MIEAIIQFVEKCFDVIGTQLLIVAASPLLADQRIFLLYLFTSALCAFYVYHVSTRLLPSRKPSFRAFIRFLFPKDVWTNPSAWLDVRYFFFNQVLKVFYYVGLSAGAMSLVFQIFTGWPDPVDASKSTIDASYIDMAVSTAYMLVFFVVGDLMAFGIHYFQHKVPVLWEFHKVHHSLEVMHPLSNYREHPVDNLFYATIIGSTFGLINGATYFVFGYLPSMPVIIGVPLLMFAFNFLAYNLRHSHVWLRWPGRWSMLFGSPAHHQIHHSYHPDHLNKNFAFMFPFWDVLFGTYQLPETNKDVRFGISETYVNEFKSCLGIYLIPFKNVWLRYTKGRGRLVPGESGSGRSL